MHSSQSNIPLVRCRLHIDEVGNGDLSPRPDDPNGRYLSLTGVITRVADYTPKFVSRINALKTSAFGENGASVVLHRREIVRREGVFGCLRDPALATTFDEGLAALVRELPYLATTIVIDKTAHLEAYGDWTRDPYHYCLQALVERYVLWMHRHKYNGDVAIEGRGKKPDRRVKESFREIYQSGTEHIRPSIVQQCLTSQEIKFMKKSDNCPVMQIVDMIAHPSFRSMKLLRLGEPIPTDYGTRLVSILDGWKYARHPKSRVMDGWGKKWLPK